VIILTLSFRPLLTFPSSAEREQRRLLSGRSADFIALGLSPSARESATTAIAASSSVVAAASAAAVAAAESVPFMDETGADESRWRIFRSTAISAIGSCILFLWSPLLFSIVNLLASEVAADYFQVCLFPSPFTPFRPPSLLMVYLNISL
jgi:hypothetical protein